MQRSMGESDGLFIIYLPSKQITKATISVKAILFEPGFL